MIVNFKNIITCISVVISAVGEDNNPVRMRLVGLCSASEQNDRVNIQIEERQAAQEILKSMKIDLEQTRKLEKIHELELEKSFVNQKYNLIMLQGCECNISGYPPIEYQIPAYSFHGSEQRSINNLTCILHILKNEKDECSTVPVFNSLGIDKNAYALLRTKDKNESPIYVTVNSNVMSQFKKNITASYLDKLKAGDILRVYKITAK